MNCMVNSHFLIGILLGSMSSVVTLKIQLITHPDAQAMAVSCIVAQTSGGIIQLLPIV